MKLVEYKPRASVRNIALVVFCCAFTLWLLLAALYLFADIQPLGRITESVVYFLVLLPAFLLVTRKRAVLYPLLVLCVALNAAFLLVQNDGAEYLYPSPNQKNALVVTEQSALFSSGQTQVYRRKWLLFKQRLPYQLGTDDRYSPFSYGQYRLDWQDEDTVLLVYYNGHAYTEQWIELEQEEHT